MNENEESTEDAEMDAGLQSLENSSQRLTDAVLDMAKRLNYTEKVQAQLGKQQLLMESQMATNRKQHTTNTILGLSIVLDVILSLALGYGAYRVDRNADLIKEIQDRTSSEVLCPQYVLWLGLVKASEQRPDQTPEQKLQAAEFKAVFQKGYDDLGCATE